MSNIAIHHDQVRAALSNHHAAHTEALAALTPPSATGGVPADVMASVGQLLAVGRSLHEDAVAIGREGDAANHGLQATDEANAGRFGGES